MIYRFFSQSRLFSQPGMGQGVGRTVVAVGLVSFFTDVSSEMIFPLLPLFLISVLGAGPLSLGLIEGLADSTASLLKLASGVLSDRLGRRKPFVVAGYSLSNLLRPFIGLAAVWPTVLALRFFDRVGKGLRSSPRDALVADLVPQAHRGAVYGFHRAMDNLGAVVGPLVAAALLYGLDMGLRQIFLWALAPGLMAVLVVMVWVREPPVCRQPAAHNSPLEDWRELGWGYKRFLALVSLMGMAEATEAFFLLHLSQVGVGLTWVAVIWSGHSLVRAISAYLAGGLSDRVGRKPPVLAGWLVFVAAFASFALVQNPYWLTAIFLAYGLYYGLAQGAERAWISDLAPAHLRGTAFGYYHGALGLTALPASLVFGWLGQSLGAAWAFGFCGLLGLLATILLALFPPPRQLAQPLAPAGF